MGYYLLDNHNPNGDHFYDSRRLNLTAITVHITAGLEDLDTVDDHSAENTAAYAASTSREVSWHSGSDADSYLYLLPPHYTAWHAGNYNSSTYGHEISKKHTDWRTMPEDWVRKTLKNAAKALAPIVRQYNIPIRKATRAEVDRARVTGVPVGFISHAELQPQDRTDPGWVSGIDTFPWQQFLGYVQAYVSGTEPDEEDEDTMLAFQVSGEKSANATDVHEKLIHLPWRIADGAAVGPARVFVTVASPGQPTDQAGKDGVLDIQLAHWQIAEPNKPGRIEPALPDNTKLPENTNTGGLEAPHYAWALVVQYISPGGMEAVVVGH